MFSDYHEVRNWLESFIPYTYSKENLGLERIRYFLKLLGNPQEKFKSIHVAGTSGKGSTAFYIAKLLQFANPAPLKIGLHVSPHLSYIGERMQIFTSSVIPAKAGIRTLDPFDNTQGKQVENDTEDGVIPVKRLIVLVNEIRPIVEAMKGSKIGSPSYFEILVAASFLYFAKKKVDWAVVETGLGGRLDATNVLNPKLSVITNVGLDHTDILGKTIEKIALEKAGIIKKGTPLVTAASGKALKVIEKVAKEKNAPLIKVDTQNLEKRPKPDIKDYLIICRDIERYIDSSFASSNFLLALKSVLTLGFSPDEKSVGQVSKLVFPGRFEKIDKNVILDAAHNVDKVKFLTKNIKVNTHSNYSNNQIGIVLVVAFKKGKDWKKMVDILVKNLPVKKVIATKFWAVTDTGRFAAVEPKEIVRYLKSKWKIEVESFENSQEAVFKAINTIQLTNYQTTQPVLITGSLYLVGEARTLWNLPEF